MMQDEDGHLSDALLESVKGYAKFKITPEEAQQTYPRQDVPDGVPVALVRG
jgi:hypothetical protein